MARYPITLATALAALFLANGAIAGPVECEAVQNSFKAVSAVPGYRQVVEVTAPNSSKMEFVVIGETIYAQISGKWTKIPMRAGARASMLANILETATISDCTEIRAETLPVGRMKVYRYTMTPLKPKSGPALPGGPVESEIWVGVADGLVHRLISPNTHVDLDFRTQIPPIP